jgi:hypothetical protein
MKKILITIIMSIVLLFIFSLPTFASTPLEVITLPAQSNVSIDKEWNIRFSTPVDINTLNDNLILKDSNGTLFNIYPTVNPLDSTVIIVKHITPFKNGTNYILTVNSGIKSLTDKTLSKTTQLSFSTIAKIEPTIVYVEDINKSINQSDSYSLPSTVEAIMSDSSKKQVNIVWNISTVNTSITGTQIFYGNVVGCDKQVKLTLNINEKIQTINDVQQLIIGKWVAIDKGVTFEFFSDGTFERMYLSTLDSTPIMKYESTYSFSSSTRIKFQDNMYYIYILKKWTNTNTSSITDMKISDNELTLFNWNEYGDLVLTRS